MQRQENSKNRGKETVKRERNDEEYSDIII